jgi:hypothetical protein
VCGAVVGLAVRVIRPADRVITSPGPGVRIATPLLGGRRFHLDRTSRHVTTEHDSAQCALWAGQVDAHRCSLSRSLPNGLGRSFDIVPLSRGSGARLADPHRAYPAYGPAVGACCPQIGLERGVIEQASRRARLCRPAGPAGSRRDRTASKPKRRQPGALSYAREWTTLAGQLGGRNDHVGAPGRGRSSPGLSPAAGPLIDGEPNRAGRYRRLCRARVVIAHDGRHTVTPVLRVRGAARLVTRPAVLVAAGEPEPDEPPVSQPARHTETTAARSAGLPSRRPPRAGERRRRRALRPDRGGRAGCRTPENAAVRRHSRR